MLRIRGKGVGGEVAHLIGTIGPTVGSEGQRYNHSDPRP